MPDAKFVPIKIPPDAKTEDIVALLNMLQISVNVNSETGSKFMYSHKKWIDEHGT